VLAQLGQSGRASHPGRDLRIDQVVWRVRHEMAFEHFVARPGKTRRCIVG
jgi:hypothetical protein